MSTAIILRSLMDQVGDLLAEVRRTQAAVTQMFEPTERGAVEDELLRERGLPLSLVWIYQKGVDGPSRLGSKELVIGYKWQPAAEPLLKLQQRLRNYATCA